MKTKSIIRQEIPFLNIKETLKIFGVQIMGIAGDIKKVAEEIVSSYQYRISTVSTIIDNTYQLLEDFKVNRNQMSNQLKETLAKEESLRKKDFDYMMRDILYQSEEIEKQVRELLKTFFQEQKEIAETIRKSLSEGEKIRITDFKKMLQDIQARQKVRENEVSVMLKAFQKEHKEMTESLRGLLDKQKAIRIKDFKDVMKNIRSRQIERAKEVRTRLDEFRKERKDGLLEWNKLTIVMAEKRVVGGEVREKEEVIQGK